MASKKIKGLNKTALAALLLIVALGSCTTPMPYQRYEGLCWGTTFHLTYESNVKLDRSEERRVGKEC